MAEKQTEITRQPEKKPEMADLNPPVEELTPEEGEKVVGGAGACATGKHIKEAILT